LSTTRLRSRSALILAALIILVLLGIAAAAYQVQQGLIVTNMRNPFSWGLYIAMWAFFVGTAAGGMVVTAATYLFRVERLKLFGRVASLTAVIFTLAAMVMLLPDLGRPDRLHHLFLYPQFGSVLIWDFIVLSTYAVLAAVYTYVQMRPDIASQGIKLPLLGVVGKKNPNQAELTRMKEKAEKQARAIAPIALVFAVLIHTVTAWVLATQLSRGWWFGGALAPSFIASAVASGPAVVILASLYVIRRSAELKQAYATLGKIAAFGAVILLFIYYNDFVVRAWWGEGMEFETLWVVFTRYLPVHLAEIVFVLLGVFLLVKLGKNARWLIAGSLSMIIGVLFHRYLLMPSAYNVFPLRIPSAEGDGLVEWPYPTAIGEITASLDKPAPLFVSWWSYFPSPVEFIICAGLVAALVLGFVLLSKILPVTEAVK
jgi:molybdopterin-containing oxidoreductase family membrane subunit